MSLGAAPGFGDGLVVIAHRGARYQRPENTLSALQCALDLGLTWVECDVRLTADRVPVLIHDERITFPTGAAAVRELTYADLYAYDVGDGNPVPQLEEVLMRFASSPLNFDFDVKELDAMVETARLVRRFGMEGRVVLSSFIPDAIRLAQEQFPEIPRGLLIDRLTGTLVDDRSSVRAAQLLHCAFILPEYHRVDADFVLEAHRADLRVVVWTVNRPEDGIRMVQAGVDGIITDRPDLIVGIGARRSASG